MASRAAKVRAAVTAVGVVLGIALLLGVVILALALGVNVIGNALVGGGDTGPTQVPDIEFETTLENETVVVHHAGGPTVNASAVTLAINGDEKGTWAMQSDGETEHISDGDTVSLYGVAPGDELAVRWTDGTSSWPVFTETLGDDQA